MTSNGRSRWNAVRFLTTLNYFGEVPFLGSFRWVQQLLGQSPISPGMTFSALKKTVVVIGDKPSTDGLAGSSGVFEALRRRLPSSIELMFYALDSRPVDDGNQQDHAIAETTSQQTCQLPPALRQLMGAADTVIVLDVPNRPTLVTEVAALGNPTFVERSVFDFSTPTCNLAVWGALDDVVMGGVSQGSFFLRTPEKTSEKLPKQTTSEPTSQSAVFAGYVSTDNSGGFSSVRTRNFEPPFDFSGWHGIRLHVKGDGQRYKFIARNSAGWDSPAYIYSFDTVADTWQNVAVPFSEMVPTFRARSMPNAPAFNPETVFSLQLMLSKFEYDRQLNPHFTAGPFELAVSRMSVYRPRQEVSWVVIVGAQGENVRGQQQAILNEAQLNYRWIEPGSVDLIDALVQAVT